MSDEAADPSAGRTWEDAESIRLTQEPAVIDFERQIADSGGETSEKGMGGEGQGGRFALQFYVTVVHFWLFELSFLRVCARVSRVCRVVGGY